jgi:hypothetical protein
LTARCGSSTKIGVNDAPALDRDELAAKLRAGLVDVLRAELWRQATEAGDFYASYDIPGTNEVREDISYEGEIELGDLADAIIKAIETRKIGPYEHLAPLAP